MLLRRVRLKAALPPRVPKFENQLPRFYAVVDDSSVELVNMSDETRGHHTIAIGHTSVSPTTDLKRSEELSMSAVRTGES